MFNVAFERNAQKEFLKLSKQAQEFIALKIIELKNGNFTGDKALKGKHKNKYAKRTGDYRIIYFRENNILLITIIRVAHRKEVY